MVMKIKETTMITGELCVNPKEVYNGPTMNRKPITWFFLVIAVLFGFSGLKAQSITLFNDPAYGASEDDGTCDDEVANLQFLLTDLGFSYDEISSIDDFEDGLVDKDVLIFPEQEQGDLSVDISNSDKQAIQDFTAQGGTTIISFSSPVLEGLFDIAINVTDLATGDMDIYLPHAEGTCFEGVDELLDLDATGLFVHDLPPNSKCYYKDATDYSSVVSLSYGLGNIFYIGWDFFDAANACGQFNADWNSTLACAIEVGLTETRTVDCIVCPEDRTLAIDNPIDCDLDVEFPFPEITSEEAIDFTGEFDPVNWDEDEADAGSIEFTMTNSVLTVIGSDITNNDPDESADIVTVCVDISCSGTLNFKYNATTSSSVGGSFEDDMAGYILNGVEEDLTDPLSGPSAAPPIDVNLDDEFCFYVRSNHFEEYTTLIIEEFSFEPVFTTICAPEIIPKDGYDEPDMQPEFDMTGMIPPVKLDPGKYTVLWRFKDEYARVQYTCEEDLVVEAWDPGGITCQHVNLSLDGMCTAELTADMVVTNDEPGCLDNYEVTIEDEYGFPVENPLDGTHVGKTLHYKVCIPSIHLCCWNTVSIEDYIAPQIECTDVEVNCGDIDSAPFPILTSDNCGDEEIFLVDSVFHLLDCHPRYVASVKKVWGVVDKAGNYGDTCHQKIHVLRVTADGMMPDPPPNYMGANALECGSPTDPLSVGVPTFKGEPLYPNGPLNYCSISAHYWDQTLPTSGDCNTFIMRHWEVIEWHCNGETKFPFTQIINLEDRIGPEFTVPQDYTIGAGSDCGATTYLPAAYAHDECAGILAIHLNSDHDYVENGGMTGADMKLEIGDNIVQYIAIDSCYNETIDEVVVTVVDLREPVPICDPLPFIGLDIDGKAILNAETVDGGSFDDCGPVTLEIAKMDETCEPDDVVFGKSVKFCCEDVGISMVILKVTDVYGNESQCMMPVEIRDLYVPEILSPENDTVECTTPYDISNLSPFGNPDLIGGCIDSLIERVEENIDDCGQGYIKRTFVAFNSKGDSSTKTQYIVFENNDPFDGDTDIEWLNDTTLFNICLDGREDTENFILPNSKDDIGINKDNCDLIGISYKDSLYQVGGDLDACYGIRRIWKVVDWCQRPNGQYLTWEETQTITVEDNIDPVIDTLYIYGAIPPTELPGVDTITFKSCDPSPIISRAVGNTNCDDTIRWSWVLKEYGLEIANSMGAFNVAAVDTAQADLNIEDEGTYTIEWLAEDGCGNEVLAIDTFYVKNKKGAVPYAKPITRQLQQVTVDVFEVAINIEELDNGSYHECDGVGIDLSFSPDPNDDVRIFDCSYADSTVVDTLYVTDDLGNVNFVTTTITITAHSTLNYLHFYQANIQVGMDEVEVCVEDIVIDTMVTCDNELEIAWTSDLSLECIEFTCANEGINERYLYYEDSFGKLDSALIEIEVFGACNRVDVSGDISTNSQEMMPAVRVNLIGSELAPDFTDANGYYAFDDMPLGGSYSVAPYLDEGPLDGVSTLDLVMIQRHVLGIQTLEDPYQLIAADVNNSEDISAIDLIELRKLILGIYDSFPSNTSWRFVDSDYQFPVPTDPWVTAFPESYSINALLSDMHIPFIGVKTGDVNASVSMDLGNFDIINRSQSATLTIIKESDYQYKLKTDSEYEISGMQMELKLNGISVTNLESIESDHLNLESYNWQIDPERNVISISWNDSQHSRLIENSVMTFVFNRSIESLEIEILEDRLMSEMYTSEMEIVDIELRNGDDHIKHSSMSLHPNPWIDALFINVHSDINTKAELEVYNVSGVLIYNQSVTIEKGVNKVSLSEKDVTQDGVYYINVRSESFDFKQKMIKIN